MQRLAARPHHVGSPYDKDNAEWMLAKFKEWGLDATSKASMSCFPRRKSALVELVEPTKFTAKLAGAGAGHRSHFEPASRTTSRPTTPIRSMAT